MSGMILIAWILAAAASAQPGASFFLGTDTKTGSSAVVVDPKGGHHLAFAQHLPMTDKPQFFYYYCPSDCTNDENWNGVSGGDAVTEVQLAVTPFGQPRLLVRSTNPKDSGNLYEYFECDHDCSEGANWDGTEIFTRWGTDIFDLHDLQQPQRSFALDPWGRPRVVYFDRNYLVEPDHYGTFYTWCDAKCTRRENWREVQISTPYAYDFEPYAHASLTFTREGAPRIVAGVLTLSFTNEPSGVYYAGCDRGCERFENWKRVFLIERGQGDKPSWDVELDSQDRPRAVVYGGPSDDKLYYLSCDADCFQQASWRRQQVAVPQSGGYHPDLELTADGKPRIAYVQARGGGVGMVSCESGCEAAGASWSNTEIEGARVLDAEYPVARPRGCDAGLWTALSPVLSLDFAGRARVAYDAKYDTRCLYQDPTRPDPPYYRFTELWHTGRVLMLP